MKASVRISLVIFGAASCAAPYADSLTPPKPEICAAPRGEARRPTACAVLVGTVVDTNGYPVPFAAIAYALKDRTRDIGGRLFEGDADASGTFHATLYRFAGRATNPDTATVLLYASTVSPRRVAQGLEPPTPRWEGVSETVVTYVRLGSAVAVTSPRIVIGRYVLK